MKSLKEFYKKIIKESQQDFNRLIKAVQDGDKQLALKVIGGRVPTDFNLSRSDFLSADAFIRHNDFQKAQNVLAKSPLWLQSSGANIPGFAPADGEDDTPSPADEEVRAYTNLDDLYDDLFDMPVGAKVVFKETKDSYRVTATRKTSRWEMVIHNYRPEMVDTYRLATILFSAGENRVELIVSNFN